MNTGPGTAILLILVLAAIVEGLIEYLAAPAPAWTKAPMAAVLGVALCVVYGADLLALAGFPAIYPVAGQILTGVLIGRGSNFINDLWSRFLVPSPLPAPAAVAKLVSGPRLNWRPAPSHPQCRCHVDPLTTTITTTDGSDARISTAPSEGFRDFPDRGPQ